MYRLLNLRNIFSNNDNKIILQNIIGTFLIRGIALIIAFFTLPAYISYFENQNILGLWFTILSVLTWILTFDFGIGNGLRNKLVKALVSKNKLLIKQYISSAYILIGTIIIIIAVLAILFFGHINWNVVFNIPQNIVSKKILSLTVYIVFLSIILQMFFKLINSILYALQKSALNNFLNLITNLIIYIFVIQEINLDLSKKLILLALVYGLAINIPLLFASIIVFNTKLKDSKPNFKYFNKKYAVEVIRLGGIFFWVQVMYMLITATNEILISIFTSPDMVVEYQIYNKIFTLISLIFIIVLTPIWSMVTKALYENNYIWLKKLYTTLKVLTLLAIICQFTIILFLQLIIDLWLGENAIEVNYFNAIIFALYGGMFVWIGVLSSITNGLGQLKIQSIFYTLAVILKIPIAWFLVTVLDSWIGVVVANLIGLSLFCIIQPLWLDKFLNMKINLLNNK